ncbi:MAG: hypothetical protein ABR936_11990 [Bacteroidota bacterium]|jgi:hypothetical protein
MKKQHCDKLKEFGIPGDIEIGPRIVSYYPNLELNTPLITPEELLKQEKQVYERYKHIKNRFFLLVRGFNRFVLSIKRFIEGLKGVGKLK